MSKPKFTSKTGTDTLIKYAADNLGIDLSGKERKEVVAEIKKADPSLFEDDKSKDSQGSNKPNQDAEVKGKELVAVTLNIVDDAGEDEDADNFVQIGVNGVMHQVIKGEDVKVPVGVYDVLNNAVESRYKTVTDKDTKVKSLKETKIKRWPFSIIERHYAEAE